MKPGVNLLQGSKELKAQLPYGAMRSMAQAFGCTERWIGRVVSGADKGDPMILQCANELADLEFEKREAIQKILDDYNLKKTA